MKTATVTVGGMSCAHCASSVRDQIGDIPGVTAVDVDLTSGTVTINSDAQIESVAIKDAIEEAGYQLAG